MSNREFNIVKNKSNDRIIVLEKIEGLPTKAESGTTDNRLFSGDNQLHAIIDTKTMLWSLKYDSGLVPPPLRQQFTSYTKLISFVTDYFKRRNIRVAKVID